MPEQFSCLKIAVVLKKYETQSTRGSPFYRNPGRTSVLLIVELMAAVAAPETYSIYFYITENKKTLDKNPKYVYY